MSRSTLLPAALVLAAGVVPTAAAAADGPADGEAVVRLSAPAAPVAGADAEGVVIRAQNRAGRGRKVAERPQPTRRVVRRQATPRPMPMPARGAVRPVSGEFAATAPAPAPVIAHGQVVGEPVATTCPQCNGQCQPGVPCPGCLALGGHGLFAPGGYFNRGGVWTPQHVHNYSYNEPRNLLYPPNSNPAVPGQQGPMPVVQYPYYTTKGPDDFFTDRDGEF